MIIMIRAMHRTLFIAKQVLFLIRLNMFRPSVNAVLVYKSDFRNQNVLSYDPKLF